MSEKENSLKSGVVTSFDAATQSFGFIGPVFVMAFVTTFVAAGAGLATPLVVLVCGFGSIAVGYVVAQFATRYKAAGSMYTYISQARGPSHVFMGGWIYIFGALAGIATLTVGMGGWASIFFEQYMGLQFTSFPLWPLSWWPSTLSAISTFATQHDSNWLLWLFPLSSFSHYPSPSFSRAAPLETPSARFCLRQPIV